MIFEQSGGSLRSRRNAAGGVEGSGPRIAGHVGHRSGQLELEVGSAVSLGRCSVSLCRSSCLNYLHRLGFAFKRPKKRLIKADEAKREAFVAEYAALWDEAGRTGAKIFFADEAHFRADAELRGKWVLKGEPALVDSSSSGHGEKANYYTRRCAWRRGRWNGWNLEGNSNGESSVAFLEQLRERHGGRLNVIWDNAPAHRGPAMRSYLETPGLNLRLVNLRGYKPGLQRG